MNTERQVSQSGELLVDVSASDQELFFTSVTTMTSVVLVMTVSSSDELSVGSSVSSNRSTTSIRSTSARFLRLHCLLTDSCNLWPLQISGLVSLEQSKNKKTLVFCCSVTNADSTFCGSQFLCWYLLLEQWWRGTHPSALSASSSSSPGVCQSSSAPQSPAPPAIKPHLSDFTH